MVSCTSTAYSTSAISLCMKDPLCHSVPVIVCSADVPEQCFPGQQQQVLAYHAGRPCPPSRHNFQSISISMGHDMHCSLLPQDLTIVSSGVRMFPSLNRSMRAEVLTRLQGVSALYQDSEVCCCVGLGQGHLAWNSRCACSQIVTHSGRQMAC